MQRRAPVAVVMLLLAALGAQVAWHGGHAARTAAPARPLTAAPPVAALRLASLGDAPALSHGLMLALQGADAGMPLRALDYGHVAGWLDAALALDPRSQHPLLAATQVYGAVADPARVRIMLAFVERAFVADPARRWPWLAQAALLARHRLHDMPLARRYARALRLQAPGAPAWARELEIFILQDQNELDSARAVTGALLSGGTVTDLNEVRFLQRKLEELEAAAR